MVSFEQYCREFAAAMRRHQRRNRKRSVREAVRYMKTRRVADRVALAGRMAAYIIDTYGDAKIEASVGAALDDLRGMYLAGLLDDTDIDVGGCSLHRDLADTASS